MQNPSASSATIMANQSGNEKQWTVGELLNWTAKYLAEQNVESPRVDAEILLANVLGCQRIDLYGMRFGETATTEQRAIYRDTIRRRLEGCPVAYIVGRKEFFQLRFDVSRDVLIPRPDSETLVLECLTMAKKHDAPRILDIGTGSGNLAVALAVNLPTAQITAVDISESAIVVATNNAETHKVANRIRFVHGDLFDTLDDEAKFDFIISNPPYIGEVELADLPVGVRDFEPRQALDGGADGFAVFRRLVSEAPHYLSEGGYLLVEIGAPQEKEARQIIEKLGRYRLSPTVRDLSGHPRVLIVRTGSQ